MGKTGKCKYCGRKFTEEDYEKASRGIVGDECLVGDWDDICYPCQLKDVNRNMAQAKAIKRDLKRIVRGKGLR